jgi:hypothetical protein
MEDCGEQENDEWQMRLMTRVGFHAGTFIGPQSFVKWFNV